jgi:hypothetical protein
MTATSGLAASGLPEVVGRFADGAKGFIVFSGTDTAAVRSSAVALARVIQERTGRAVTVIDSGQDGSEMQDQPFTRVTASDRFQQPVQVRKAAEAGAEAVLIDCLPDADTLIEAVEAAWSGVLVIITMNFSGYAYSRLIDLLQSAEDWEIRPKFDAMLYAVVQPAGSGPGEEADVFIPGFSR